MALGGGELPVDTPFETFVALAHDIGIQTVDLWYPQHLREMALATQAGLRLSAVGSATELGDDTQADRHQSTLIDALHVAAAYGARYVNTYFGQRPVVDDDRSIGLYVDRLRPVLREAERLRVVVTLENEFDAFGRDPIGSDPTRRAPALRRLVAAAGSDWFRLTFDPCNALFAGLDPAADFWELLWPFVAYVHVKDGRRLAPGEAGPSGWRRFEDHGETFTTCELGAGSVGWHRLLAHLRERHYRGALCLEPHADASLLEAAWRQAAGWLRCEGMP